MNEIVNKNVFFRDLGLIPYEEALAIQTQAFAGIIDAKIKNRDLTIKEKIPTDNYLFFCEHSHVYTLGRSGSKDNLLIAEEKMLERQVKFYETGRGGDITYHGPGQLVAYPVLDLDNFFTDIHKYMRYLEEAVIKTLGDFGIDAGRIPSLTGVWLDYEQQLEPRKICAFGVKTSRWVSMHGLSLNVSSDLSYFDHIVPCGIADKGVTSMSKELGKSIHAKEVREKLLHHLSVLFEMNITV